MREDYSPDGEAWTYLPHDQARSKAYRWGEDAIAGFADDKLATSASASRLWNGQDAILKERLFGLTNSQGNHGEDVKELYYYLDGTPTHSYMRMLYKYPQAAFPYEDLVETNAKRSLTEREYEIIDTGLFDQDRYFDVTVEYAKAAPDDVLMLVTIANRGDAEASLHVLPQLWSRNTWTWSGDAAQEAEAGGERRRDRDHRPPRHAGDAARLRRQARAAVLRQRDQPAPPLRHRGQGLLQGRHRRPCRGRHRRRGEPGARRHQGRCALHAERSGARRDHARLRLCPAASQGDAFADFDATMQARRDECDAFYVALQAGMDDADKRLVQRQAFAGMLWSKQYYGFDIRQWLTGDPAEPRPPYERLLGRDSDWNHLCSDDIFSMPDAWEYPWFAAWDLAFHCVTFALIDPAFAKAQLVLLLQSRFLHPNGQIPAYEWNFGDTNPPVHALAAIQIFDIDRARCGCADLTFLRRVFHKLTLNFTWWVNREDSTTIATSSRAASSVSTTSRCSTAAARCRRAAISTRPTAPPGPPSTRST